MNCCDEFGNCRQSRDCPCRTGVVTPEQARHQCRVMYTGLMGGAFQNTVPPEAGNVRLVDTDLHEPEPSKLKELLVVALMFFGFLFGSVALVFIALGYGWVRLGTTLAEVLS